MNKIEKTVRPAGFKIGIVSAKTYPQKGPVFVCVDFL
jgi:hypothetical protein